MLEEPINTKILDTIIDILVEDFSFDREKLHLDGNLQELGLDSIDAVDLIVALEKTFEFRAEEEKAKKIRTLYDIVKFVEESIQEKALKPA
ncbi:MAG: acyl carrier protein [Candidatus Brocadiae bacterium]|nr:acyl carrier protein [Candidatus Brocadiia bacterium]